MIENSKSCFTCKHSIKVHIHTTEPPHKWKLYCSKLIDSSNKKELLDAVINPSESLLREIIDLSETCDNYQKI